MEKSDKDREIGLFRHGLISSLLNTLLNSGDLSRKIRKICREKYLHPVTGKMVEFTERTIYRWLKKFRKNGIDGLLPKQRDDKGIGRKLSTDVLQKAIEIRKDLPGRTDRVVLRLLEQEHGIKSLKKSTLNTQLRKAGYSRRDLKVMDEKIFIRFESKLVNDLWIGDYHDRRWLLENNNKMLYLSLFIDCYSRYVVHGEYYLAENLFTLEDSFRKAIIKHGVCKRIYIDNAKIYHSGRFKYCCLKIGAKWVYSKAYEKEGRGKIEKFNRYIKENFEEEIIHNGGCKNLEELNEYFHAWVEMEYHKKEHSEINTTPETRNKLFTKRKYPDLRDLKELFMIVDNRKVDKKTAVVNVVGKRFVTDSFLKGKRVQVHYDPHDLSYVLIYYQKIFVMKACEQKLNTKPNYIKSGKEEYASMKYDFLKAVKGEYERMIKENASLMKISSSEKEEKYYHVQDMVKDLSKWLKRKLEDNEKEDIIKFYDSYRAENKKSTQEALNYAVENFGLKHHISFYLGQIKIFILSERRLNNELY